MALNYDEKPVDKWNVKNFIDYMAAEHKRLFGCDYAPHGSWAQERGLIGTVFGTTKKEGKYDKALVKRFIDVAFSEYRPSAQYPGTNFGFMWTYRQAEFIRIKKEYDEEKRAVKIAEAPIDESVVDWFKA